MDIHSHQNNKDIIINGYKLIKFIKSGNFGDVMLMEKDGVQYAVKKLKNIIKPGSLSEKHFKRESSLPSDLGNWPKYHHASVCYSDILGQSPQSSHLRSGAFLFQHTIVQVATNLQQG